jgi:aldehyde:ferredoxin oxidoreductase
VSDFGYAGKILRVDLSAGGTSLVPTSRYADRFLGGRGIGARIYWEEVAPEIKAFDPENRLIITTGPVAGFRRLAGSRWQVCGKSPAAARELFSYANLGGSWGAYLKYAGYDGMVVQGKADKPVYLFVQNDITEIRDASFLWGRKTTDVRDMLKGELGKEVRIMAIGPAGENLVPFSILLADNDATASSGFGSVMGSKRLKAIAVAGDRRPKAADPDRVRELSDQVFRLRKGTWNVYTPAIPGKTKPHACQGCISGCTREMYELENGKRVKFFCQAGDVYRRPAIKYHQGWSEVIVQATGLCNEYGLDTAVIQPMVDWLQKCHQAGVLKDKQTGIPLSSIGSYEFIETLIRKISLMEDFGQILAQGTMKAAEVIGQGAGDLIGDTIATSANEQSDYDPRLYVVNGLLYAVEPRRPIQQIHEIGLTLLQWLEWLKGGKDGFLSTEALLTIAERYWGGRTVVDFSTYDGKALAAKMIQDREYAKECLILCDFLWPILWVRHSETHVGDPSLESQVFSAIVGRETNEKELNTIGERIFNLQRAILLREGWGGREGDRLFDFFHDQPLQTMRFNRDCLVPGRDGETVSRKGKVLERIGFERMKDEYYELRGWDVESGLQTRARLQELDLEDVADGLEKRGLLR